GSSDTRGSPKSTPSSRARSASSISAATWSSAFDGMQPSKRQAPPRRLPASITTVSSPSSAPRNAAEEPPSPPPTPATAPSTTRSPITTAGSFLSGDLAAHRPRPGDQVDAAVGLGGHRHRRADPLTERDAALLVERHAIARSRGLAAEERRPVVVEVLEDC